MDGKVYGRLAEYISLCIIYRNSADISITVINDILFCEHLFCTLFDLDATYIKCKLPRNCAKSTGGPNI